MLIKTYSGARLDLEHYKGFSIINYVFEIVNDDNTPYIFPSNAAIHLKLYAKKGGTLLGDVPMGQDSPHTNFIYLNDSSIIINQRSPRVMWHEVSSNEGGILKLIFEGVSVI